MTTPRHFYSTVRWIAARLNVRSERAATAVEYGIMLFLIAAVVIGAVYVLGDRTNTNFVCTQQAIATKGATPCP